MKVTSMKSVMKKLAFPLLVGGVLWSGGVRADDIVSIKSDQAGQTFTSSGEYIEFRVSLAGYFVLTNISGTASPAFLPELRMVVNGDLAYATLYSLSNYKLGGAFDRTDCYFRYRVKPGDMAQPLKIYGASTVPYQVNYRGWGIRSMTNINQDVVWRFDTAASQAGLGEVYDIDLVKANITIRTLSFDDAFSPPSVAATESTSWRVSSVNPTESAVVSFYVWTPGTNILQIGSVPNQTWLLVQMPTNTTFKDFNIKGLSVGSTYIYLQRPVDYANNFTSVGMTNYIRRAITVTTPPEPTVRVVMTDTATDSITLDETSVPNTGSFEVQLSEAFTNDVWVRIDASPVGQSNVTFASSPFLVKVGNGLDRSSVAKFSVPDGTVASAGAGIILTPVVVSNAAAVSYYTRQREGHVYVRNVKPVITQPLATDTPTAIQHTPYTFSWNVSDVAPDVATGMSLTWIFGDGTTNYVTHGAVGTVQHTYHTTGVKVVKVRARDKDGAESDEVQFTLTVDPPVPQPHVRLAPNVIVNGETTAVNSGQFDVYLSEPCTTPVDIMLVTDPAVQSNIVFATTNVFTIPAGQTNAPVARAFSFRDGTAASASAGIKVTPVIVNAASSYFTEMREAYVFVTNLIPIITYPVAGDILAPAVAPYDAIPMGQPFVFDYIVNDVPADRPTMQVRWSFGDGATLTATGAVGSVTHTYTSLGDKYVWVEAEDKDGGISTRIQFKVKVVAPPPPPTVRILPPPGALTETVAPNTGAFTVQLSEAFTNVVTVSLAVTPANNLVNGTIELATTLVTFTPGETEKIVRFSTRDGTDQSYTFGFTVTPTVIASPTAVAKYTTVVPGVIEIMNVNPVIQYPTASDPTGNPIYEVPQGAPWAFNWTVADVANDLLAAPIASAMVCTWYFGDGTTATVYGGSGTINHTYNITGDVVVRFVARDKDGGYSEVQFKITIKPSKQVKVNPIGPNPANPGYWSGQRLAGDGGGGYGYGMLRSSNARSVLIASQSYTFSYDPGTVSASLMAIPYKTLAGPNTYYVTNYNADGITYTTGPVYHDSFFFVWQGNEALSDLSRNPIAPDTAILKLPDSGTGGSGGTTAPETLEINAIFSLECYRTDNRGDINADGIPDSDARAILIFQGADVTDPNSWYQSLANFNDDLDFEPVNPGNGGTNDFRAIGAPFTAVREIRGRSPGLNRGADTTGPASDPDYGPGETQGDEPGAEPPGGVSGGTSPTNPDTDGDGLPDGWEYYFWRRAQIQNLNGSRFNPLNISMGTVYEWKDISTDFNPLVNNMFPGRDSDGDGLLDLEELTLGTDPTHWDTDRDGMCDSYEVLMGLNACDDRDGLLAARYNPDGDYMAIATVQRLLFTVVNGTTTNSYLAPVGTPLVVGEEVDPELVVTRWYRYGDDTAPMAVGRSLTLPAGSFVIDPAPEEVDVLVLHFQVLHEFGFDPRTAWQAGMNFRGFPRFPLWISGAPNTRPFTSRDEYLLVKFMSENNLNGAPASMPPTAGTWSAYGTHPFTPDSDLNVITRQSDAMPDGWELYVAIAPGLDLTVAANRNMTISPWNYLDGIVNLDGPPETLNNMREFNGTDSSFAYSSATLYNMPGAVGYVSIVRPAGDANWINKFWPTNPWDPDTDGDHLLDSNEQTFIYGAPADNQSTLIQGGGLNPNAMDTDLDALPDRWESDYTGTYPAGAGPFSGVVITNGMDGTVVDYTRDWDADGLANYQEYWVQAVRSLRYDMPAFGTVGELTGNDGLPMDNTFTPDMLFTPVTNPWDLSLYPWGFPVLGIQLWVLLPVGASDLYVTTDPRNPDSDYDSMDDYYEMFHGLNPILGDVSLPNFDGDLVAKAYVTPFGPLIWHTENDWYTSNPILRPAAPLFRMDFVNWPWLNGLPEADPDADGLLNLEEQVLVNTSTPQNYNTDPSPMWLTDASNPNSVVNRFYERLEPYFYNPFLPIMYFWPPTQIPEYVFHYEMNEGYDTDNDGVSDKDELVSTRNTLASPQDHDAPLRRQAIWFSGFESAASTATPFTYYETQDDRLVGDVEYGFRSFTVELWARPEVVGGQEQVLITRAFAYEQSDNSITNSYTRRNYRIGIAADGRVFADIENPGAPTHDGHTDTARTYGRVLTANQWVHLAARMSGDDAQLTLFVNGKIESAIPVSLMPANGIIIIRDYPTTGSYSVTQRPGSLVLGADVAPDALPASLFTLPAWGWEQTWDSYTSFYQGWIDEVRVWDGARSSDAILADVYKRYTYDDLMTNRQVVAAQVLAGYSRVISNPLRLSPLLMHHYTFDNLFGGERVEDVAREPRGFNAQAVIVNRPPGSDSYVSWWTNAAVRSQVYTNYCYVPWIENSVDHLPLYGGATSVTNIYLSGPLADTRYWTERSSG